MDAEKQIELYRQRLSREYKISEEYEGKPYTIVAENSAEEVQSLGENEWTKKILLFSYVQKNGALNYIQSEIEKIPQTALSGFRSISKNKTTFLIRIFLAEKIPFELIQQVRNFNFSRTEQGAFNYITSAGIILIDLSSRMVYSNKAASPWTELFKIVHPVEVLEDEENPETEINKNKSEGKNQD